MKVECPRCTTVFETLPDDAEPICPECGEIVLLEVDNDND